MINGLQVSSPIDRRFFGIQIQEIPNMRPLGFGTLRVGTTWRQLEAQKGRFDFREVDAYVAFAQQEKLDVIMQLGQPPNWATGGISSSPYGDLFNSIPPHNIQDWRYYVAALGQRYKGKILYYEVWNEPNLSGFYSGTLAKLVELTMEAYKVLKAIDPQIQIISPTYTTVDGVAGMGDFLRAGGKDWIDIVGIHLYSYPKPPEAMLDLARKYRQVITQAGAGGLPVWNTESSWNSFYYKGVLYGSDENDYSVQMPDDLAISYIHRMFLCNWIAGMERAVFYGMDQPWSRIRLLDLNRLPNVAVTGQSYQRMVEWLTGASMHQYTFSTQGIHTLSLTYADGRSGYILWMDDDRTAQLSLPPELAMSQMQTADGKQVPAAQTITVTSMPLYLKSYDDHRALPEIFPQSKTRTELLYNGDFSLRLSDASFPVGWDTGGLSVSKYMGADAPANQSTLTLTPSVQFQQMVQRLRKPLAKGDLYTMSITYKLPTAPVAGKWTMGLDVGAMGTPLHDQAFLELPVQDTFQTREVTFYYALEDPDPSPDLRLSIVNMAPTGTKQPLYISRISLTQISDRGHVLPHTTNILYSPVLPASGSYSTHDQIYFTDAKLIATEGLGWVCLSSGTFGALSGVTGTLTNGSYVLTVNKANSLRVGDYVKVGNDAQVYLIAYQESPTRYELGSTARTTQQNQTVSYVPPVFLPLAKPVQPVLPAPAALTATRSPFVYKNAQVYPVDVLVAKGAVSLIEWSRNGSTWYDTGQTGGIISLSAGDSLRITYTSAPRLTVVPR
ncbi:GH39 family glycosyl hydrolase [Brevibacillus panacihumi]|uniref:GH39 family glycosyl hydrolase n=1 Tax=Brevibacillus panacihumi TaxID=497735 RepID=UPI003D02F960